MMNFKAFLLAFVFLPFVSAYINDVAKHNGTYHATKTSKFPIKCIWSYTKVDYIDLTVSFGIAAVSDNVQGFGMPVHKNLDLIYLNKTYITQDTTFNIPLVKSDFYKGAGKYTLTTVVGSASGLNPGLVHFTTSYKQTFTVKF